MKQLNSQIMLVGIVILLVVLSVAVFLRRSHVSHHSKQYDAAPLADAMADFETIYIIEEKTIYSIEDETEDALEEETKDAPEENLVNELSTWKFQQTEIDEFLFFAKRAVMCNIMLNKLFAHERGFRDTSSSQEFFQSEHVLGVLGDDIAAQGVKLAHSEDDWEFEKAWSTFSFNVEHLEILGERRLEPPIFYPPRPSSEERFAYERELLRAGRLDEKLELESLLPDMHKLKYPEDSIAYGFLDACENLYRILTTNDASFAKHLSDKRTRALEAIQKINQGQSPK